MFLDSIKTLIGGSIPIDIGSSPPTPAVHISLYNTGGGRRSLTGTEVREPYFQVRVRHTSYKTGYELCQTIANLLHGVVQQTGFLLIAQEGDIQDLGRDKDNNSIFTINFRSYYNGT